MSIDPRCSAHLFQKLTLEVKILVAKIETLPPFASTDVMQALQVWRSTADVSKALYFSESVMRGTILGICAGMYRVELLDAARAWLGTNPATLRKAVDQMRKGVNRRLNIEKDHNTSFSDEEEDEDEEGDSDYGSVSEECEMYNPSKEIFDDNSNASPPKEETTVSSPMEIKNKHRKVDPRSEGNSEETNNVEAFTARLDMGLYSSKLQKQSPLLAQLARSNGVAGDGEVRVEKGVEETSAGSDSEEASERARWHK